MAEKLVEWENLKCVYGGYTVFSKFSGSVYEGEWFRVRGPTGSGKTSFFNMLFGFLKPSLGTIRVSGDDIFALASYVPQRLDFGVAETVGEWVERVFSYRRNQELRPDWLYIASLMRRLRLPEKILSRKPSSLSDGERQRVAIAMALTLPRKLMILDEAFSALDEETAKVVEGVVRESGRAVIYSSHV